MAAADALTLAPAAQGMEPRETTSGVFLPPTSSLNEGTSSCAPARSDPVGVGGRTKKPGAYSEGTDLGLSEPAAITNLGLAPDGAERGRDLCTDWSVPFLNGTCPTLTNGLPWVW